MISERNSRNVGSFIGFRPGHLIDCRFLMDKPLYEFFCAEKIVPRKHFNILLFVIFSVMSVFQYLFAETDEHVAHCRIGLDQSFFRFFSSRFCKDWLKFSLLIVFFRRQKASHNSLWQRSRKIALTVILLIVLLKMSSFSLHNSVRSRKGHVSSRWYHSLNTRMS